MKHIILLIFCCCLIGFSGCGEKLPSDFPKIYPITVTVMDGSSPMPGVKIMFYPVGGAGTFASSGSTDDNGVAKITTAQGAFSKVGLPAGEFIVTAEDVIDVGPRLTREEFDQLSMAEKNKMSMEQRKKHAEYERKVPVVLCNQLGAVADRSPIRFTATTGKNELKINIAEYK